MSIELNKKVYRNLPEQVAENANQIEKIKEFLDGISVEDNVVVIDDISQVLTNEELKIVKREIAFLVYNNTVYIKKNQDSAHAYFDKIFTISQDTDITFSTSEIQVTLANGALGTSDSTILTYSTTQIDNKLSDKADKTYVDTQLTYKVDKTSVPMENIKDSAGNSRFVEGNITPQTISGVSFTYAKWSLSGTHLMIVLAGTLENGAVLSNVNWANIVIPQWIHDKIYPVFAISAIEIKAVTARDNAYNSQSLSFLIGKATGHSLYINQTANLTLTSEKYFRLVFDLLIDNE